MAEEAIFNLVINGEQKNVKAVQDTLNSFKKSMAQLSSALMSNTKAINSQIDAFSKLAKAQSTAAGAAAAQSKATEGLTVITYNYNKAAQEQAQGLNKIEKEATQTAAASDKMNKSLQRGKMGMKGFSEQVRPATKELRNWQRELNQSSQFVVAQPSRFSQVLRNARQAKMVMADINKTGIATAGTMQSLEDGIERPFRRGLTSMERFRIHTHLLKKDMTSLLHHWQAVTAKMQWTGRQLMVGVTTPLALVGGMAVNAMMDISREQVRLAKVSSFSREEVRAFGGEIKQLSEDFAINQSVVTAMLADWAQMGYGTDLNQLKAIGDQILRISLLADADISTVTPFFQAVMATFAGDATDPIAEASLIMEQFNAIENNTVLSTAKLAEALPEVAGAADLVNLSASETAAILAGMHRRGFAVNEAAHALKFGLTRLINPTQDAKDHLDNLGISLFDASGQTRDTMEILNDLAQTLGSGALSDESTGQILSDLFGNRQVARMRAALEEIRIGNNELAEFNSQTQGLEDLSSHWAKATVAAEGYFDTNLGRYVTPAEVAQRELDMIKNDPSFRFDQLKTEFKNNLAEIGQIIVDPFLDVFEALNRLITKLLELPEPFKKAILGAAGFAAVIGPLIFTTAMFGKVLTNVGIGALKLLPTGITETTASLAKMDGALDNSSNKLAQLGNRLLGIGRVKKGPQDAAKAMQAHAAVYSGADAGPAAAVGFRDKFARAGTKDAAAQLTIMEALKQKARGMRETLAKPFRAAREATGKATSGMGNFFSSMKKANGGAGVLKGSVAKLGVALKSLGTAAKVAAVGLLKITVIGAVIAAVAFAVYNLVQNFDKFKEYVQPAIDKVKQSFDKVKQAVSGIIDVFTSLISSLSGSKDGVNESMSAWEAFGIAASAALDGVSKALDVVAWIVENVLKPIFINVGSAIINIFNAVKALLNGDFKEAFRQFIGFLYNSFARYFIMAFEFAADGFMSFAAQVLDGIASLLEGFSNLRQGLHDVSGPLAFLADGAGFLMGALEQGLNLDGLAENMRGGAEELRNAADFGLVEALDEEFGRLEVTAREGGRRAIRGIPVEDQQTANDFEQLGEEYGEDFGEGFEDSAGDSVQDWFPTFLGAVKSRLDEKINEIRESALEALQKQHEAELEVYDNKLEAMDEIEKQEQRLFKTQEYLARRREMLQKRDVQKLNYEKERALAIYEGRIDDARMLDLEEKANKKEHDESIRDLDESRSRDLTAQQRADEREKINAAKEAAAERLRIVEDEFKKQLEIITQYAPRTIGEFNNMVNAITQLLANNGVSNWGAAFANGVNQFGTIIANANEDIVQNAAWSGATAATAWLRAFASGDAIAAIQAGSDAGGNFNIASPRPINTGGGGAGGAGAGAGSGQPWLPPNIRRDWELDLTPSPGMTHGGPHVTGALGSILRNPDPTAAQPISGYFAEGGSVVGRVSSKDNIPAMVQAGEYVLRRSAVQRLGLGNVEALNKGHAEVMPRFAEGGFVGTMTGIMKNATHKLAQGFLDGANMLGGVSFADMVAKFQLGQQKIGGRTGVYQGAQFDPKFLEKLNLTAVGKAFEFLDTMTDPRRVIEDRRGYDPNYQARAYGNWPITGFANWLFQTFKGGVNYGTYVYRNIAGTDRLSQHAYGRAVDFGGTKQAMDNVFAFAYENYHKLGINELIYRNIQMGRNGQLKFRRKQDHWNHVHLSIHENSPVAWMGSMAKGGIVPYDGMVAKLHEKEMVLPREIAAGLTGMIKNGETPGGGHGDGCGSTIIYVDNFIGQRQWFESMMKEYDVKVKPHKERSYGQEPRRVSRIGK